MAEKRIRGDAESVKNRRTTRDNGTGCVGANYPAAPVVHPVLGWDQIYDYLILRREQKYGLYVGVLEVV